MFKKFFLLVFFAFPLFSLDLQTMVEKIDMLLRRNYSHQELEMIIKGPSWERTLLMESWTKKMTDTFVLIKSPKMDKGITTLRKRREMWSYFPKIDKVFKMPPSLMMGSWRGSDFMNDDIVRQTSFVEDYDASFSDTMPPEEGYVWISLKAKANNPSPWKELRFLVNEETFIPKKKIFYDRHGVEDRILYLDDIKEMGGELIPTTLTMVPKNKQCHSTTVKIICIEFDKPYPEEVFSLLNLKRER